MLLSIGEGYHDNELGNYFCVCTTSKYIHTLSNFFTSHKIILTNNLPAAIRWWSNNSPKFFHYAVIRIFRRKNIFVRRKSTKIIFTDIIVQRKFFEANSHLHRNYFMQTFFARKFTRLKKSKLRHVVVHHSQINYLVHKVSFSRSCDAQLLGVPGLNQQVADVAQDLPPGWGTTPIAERQIYAYQHTHTGIGIDG